MTEFWWGVMITLIVGLPGAYLMAVLAHMHTPRLVQYLESRKLLKKTQSRKQALAMFNRVRAFHDGRLDRYSFYILLASGAVVCAIIASTLLLMISIHSYEYPISIEYAIVLLVAVIAILTGLLLLGGIYETARQIDHFDSYKAEFEKRWGPIEEKELIN